jgi:tRNA(Ile)-lysidine synthase
VCTSSACLPPCAQVLPPVPALSQFSSASARLCLHVAHFIQAIVPPAANAQQGALLPCPLIIGLSGGADSTALLTLLLALRPRLGCTLHAVHINHQLRPESEAEAAHVAALCRAWGVPCECTALPIAALAAQWHMGIEEAARKARYAAFAAAQQRLGAAWVCTAHHSGDLEEDIVLRLLRGAGWPALGGMPALDAQRRIMRPLLLTEPATLRALLCELGIPWVEDASNQSRAYKRNRVRHDVLPLLKQENPAFTAGMRQLWQLAGIDAQHWQQALDAALKAHPWQLCLHTEHKAKANTTGQPCPAHSLSLPRALLRSLDQSLRLRLYKRALQHFPAAQPRAQTLLALDAAWAAGRGGTLFQLGGGICASLRQGAISFSSAAPPSAPAKE